MLICGEGDVDTTRVSIERQTTLNEQILFILYKFMHKLLGISNVIKPIISNSTSISVVT